MSCDTRPREKPRNAAESVTEYPASRRRRAAMRDRADAVVGRTVVNDPEHPAGRRAGFGRHDVLDDIFEGLNSGLRGAEAQNTGVVDWTFQDRARPGPPSLETARCQLPCNTVGASHVAVSASKRLGGYATQ